MQWKCLLTINIKRYFVFKTSTSINHSSESTGNRLVIIADMRSHS